MRVELVLMPWYTPDGPSPALGVVAAALRQRRPHDVVVERYANLEWADYAARESAGELDLAACMEIVDNGFTHSIGDWIFSNALHGVEAWNVEAYRAYLEGVGRDPSRAVAFHAFAPGFVRAVAEEILDANPDVVGFSSTYNQNVPSLALARELKDRRPGLIVVFGGANCQPPQGAALQRNFPFIDYVIAGEGELALPALLDAIESALRPITVPGVSSLVDGRQVTTSPKMMQMSDSPTPSYDAYFDRFATSTLNGRIGQYLIVETSRGCWWGAKHQCTFCGLGDLDYRSKGPEQAFDEIRALLSRHQILDMIMTDNIIEMGYFRTLLPRLIDEDWDLRMVYSIKANLDRGRLELMRLAGAFHVQPGIESLASSTMRRMSKGVTAAQNVQLLRDCRELGLEVGWSQLYGFPGETVADYAPVVAQAAALAHLPPPLGAFRISLERYSPLFDAGASVFDWVHPADCYRFIYGDVDLTDMVYIYDYASAGIVGEAEQELVDAIELWRDHGPESSLEARRIDGIIAISDRRAGWPARDSVIADPAQVAAYESLRVATSPDGLARRLAARGIELDVALIRRWLAGWGKAGLVFEDEDRYVALATETVTPMPSAGAFEWRRGPDFAIVRDSRAAGRILRHVIDGPEFEALDAIAAGRQIDERLREPAENLIASGLAERTDEGIRLLPVRKRSGPAELSRFTSPVLFGHLDASNVSSLPVIQVG